MVAARADITHDSLLQEALMLAELRRRRARDSLIAYTQHTFPGYMPADHLLEICEHLEAVERGDIDRLMIVEPPRHGKSLLTSQRFPLWYLGRNPRKEIIHASYGGDLVSDFGRNLRNLTYSPAHLDVFPDMQLAGDSKAANRWHTKQGGIYVAAGVGGPITGRGADLLLIDDPVKNREEAESEVMRAKTWDWYTNDAYTRLLPGAAVIVIQTRWHEDDLAGRLLEAQTKGHDQWVVLHHPALTREGEALWPDRYDVDALSRIRQTVGPRAWQALYQGDPTPDEGVFFEREWFRRYRKRPSYMQIYAASDWATKDEDGDFTCHIVVGVDPDGDIYVLDRWCKQRITTEGVDAMLDMMHRWKPLAWAEEAAQIEKGIGPFITRLQSERNIWGARKQFTSSADKPTKAQSIRGMYALGRVWHPEGAEWTAELESELLKFPLGKHDDQVDTMALIGRMLAGLAKGVLPSIPDDPRAIAVQPDENTALPEGYRPATYDEIVKASLRRPRRRRR